jgi:3-hydroxyacyl-CoA dehydrogenase/enoyl-CoA hydratase/3-hydroxybutyryl-CoA epimerase
MSSITCERRADGLVILTLDAPAVAVNTMDAAFKAELSQVVDQLYAERAALRGIIIQSAKSSFFAGGNLREIADVVPNQARAFFDGLQRMKASLRRFETMGVPTVALLNGHALGGGFELALSCHHRIAIDDPRIQFGCPEATLGLLPGAGGVAKLVRLLGLETALPYLVEGRRISPREARDLGLVDQLVATRDDLMTAALAWLASKPGAVQPWDHAKGTAAGRNQAHESGMQPAQTPEDLLAAGTSEEMTAAEAIRAAAEQGAQSDFDTALLLESRYLTRLVTGRYARNMIGTLFFQMNELRAGAGRPHGIDRVLPRQIGILADDESALTIAARCAARDLTCVVHAEATEVARQLRDALSAQTGEGEGMPPAKGTAGRSKIAVVEGVDAQLGNCDLFIDIRSRAPSSLPSLPCRLAAAGETSAMLADKVIVVARSVSSITQLARGAAHPERIVGMRFAETLRAHSLVEIVRGTQSGSTAVARAFDLAVQLGALPIVVGDSEGQLVARATNGYLIEAMALLGEGVAPGTIEEVALNAGMARGPLAMLDEGAFEAIDRAHHDHHDHAHHGHEPRGHEHHGHEHHGHEHHGHEHHGHEHHGHEHHGHEHHGHEHHGHEHHGHEHHGHEHHGHEPRPSGALPESAVYVLEKMAHGFHRAGRRHGGGFYDYADDGSRELWPGLSTFVRKSRRTPSADEARDRLLYIQVIETLRCLQEGVITSTRDANIGSIFGWGFPERTGGAAQFVNHVGVASFVARARELAQRHGNRFAPPALLVRLADENRSL